MRFGVSDSASQNSTSTKLSSKFGIFAFSGEVRKSRDYGCSCPTRLGSALPVRRISRAAAASGAAHHKARADRLCAPPGGPSVERRPRAMPARARASARAVAMSVALPRRRPGSPRLGMLHAITDVGSEGGVGCGEDRGVPRGVRNAGPKPGGRGRPTSCPEWASGGPRITSTVGPEDGTGGTDSRPCRSVAQPRCAPPGSEFACASRFGRGWSHRHGSAWSSRHGNRRNSCRAFRLLTVHERERARGPACSMHMHVLCLGSPVVALRSSAARVRPVPTDRPD